MSLEIRVPVFDAGNPSPELASQPCPVGLNKPHERRLMGALVHWYGWRLLEDGNLYNPRPNEDAWGGRVG